MHPKALLDACAELVRLTLRFEHPADATVSRFFRDHKGLGPRERATMAETVYTVLRKKLLFDHLAPSGSGPKERRLAILGFYGPGDFLRSALTDQEKNWLDACEKVKPDDLMERHRHNLPEWLVQPLKDQLGTDFWPLMERICGSFLGDKAGADVAGAHQVLDVAEAVRTAKVEHRLPFELEAQLEEIGVTSLHPRQGRVLRHSDPKQLKCGGPEHVVSMASRGTGRRVSEGETI